MLMLYPIALSLALLVGVIVIALTRWVSLGSMVGALLVPLFIYLLGEMDATFWFSVVIALLVIIRHHSNIERLLKGTENKISFKKKPNLGGESDGN
jgi:glycerol-3-phosphate acyltransferase PlsY